MDIARLLQLVSEMSSSRVQVRTVALIVSLVIATTVALILVVAGLGTAVLRVVPALVVILRVLLLLLLLLLLLRVAAVALGRLEGLRRGLKRLRAGTEAATGLLALVEVELLLRLPRQVLVLRGRVVLPRVQVSHSNDRVEVSTGTGSRLATSLAEEM